MVHGFWNILIPGNQITTQASLANLDPKTISPKNIGADPRDAQPVIIVYEDMGQRFLKQLSPDEDTILY